MEEASRHREGSPAGQRPSSRSPSRSHPGGVRRSGLPRSELGVCVSEEHLPEFRESTELGQIESEPSWRRRGDFQTKTGGEGGGERRENTNPHNHVSLFVRLKVSPDKQTGAPLHSSELLPWQHRLLRRPGAHKASLCEPKMFVRIRKRCLKEFLVVFLSPRMMFADTTPTSLCVVFVMFCRIFILLAHCDLEVPHK